LEIWNDALILLVELGPSVDIFVEGGVIRVGHGVAGSARVNRIHTRLRGRIPPPIRRLLMGCLESKPIESNVRSDYDKGFLPRHKDSHAAFGAVEVIADGITACASCFLARRHLLIAINDRSAKEE